MDVRGPDPAAEANLVAGRHRRGKRGWSPALPVPLPWGHCHEAVSTLDRVQIGGLGVCDEARDGGRSRVGGGLHVEAEELDASPARPVELAHPLDEVQELPRLSPLGDPRDQRLRVAPPGEDVLVHPVGLGHIGLDGEKGEAHVRGEVLDDAVLHPEELVRAARDLAQRHDAGIPDDSAQGREVAIGAAGLARGEGPRTLPEPLDRGPVGRGRGGAAGNERDDDKSDGAAAQPRARGAHGATSNVELRLESDQESLHRSLKARLRDFGRPPPSPKTIRPAAWGTTGRSRIQRRRKRRSVYFKCFETCFVISNMLT